MIKLDKEFDKLTLKELKELQDEMWELDKKIEDRIESMEQVVHVDNAIKVYESKIWAYNEILDDIQRRKADAEKILKALNNHKNYLKRQKG